MHYCKFLTTVLLSMTAGLLATIPAAAQTCTTTWPYLYPDFQDGTVYMSGGRSQHLKFNIHMLRTTLHYIELGMIKEAYPRDIDSIRIGNDLFRYVNGVPMRVAAAGTSGYVAELLQGDFASALEGSGAYGMSAATISKTELSSLEVSGGTNQNHMLLLQNKDQGRTADIRGGRLHVGGRAEDCAVFKYDYYWLAPSCPDGFKDGTTGALVPDNHIIGRVMTRLYKSPQPDQTPTPPLPKEGSFK